MPKKNRRNRRNRVNRQKRQVGYAPFIPRSFNRPTSMNITLHTYVNVASGLTAVNGGTYNVYWRFFNDAAVIAPLYKYFEVEAYQLRFSLSTTTGAADSFYAGALAFDAINYWVEGVNTTPPTSLSQVTDLPGSIYVQAGAKNFGRYYNPMIKQQFSCSDAFNSSSTRSAGVVAWYFEDLGVSETVGVLDLAVNLRFYQREYDPSIPSMPPPRRVLPREDDSPEESKVEYVVSAIPKKR